MFSTQNYLLLILSKTYFFVDCEFVPGFLVVSGTDSQIWPENFSLNSTTPNNAENNYGYIGPVSDILGSVIVNESEQMKIPSNGSETSVDFGCSMVAFSVFRANIKTREAKTTPVQIIFDKILTNVGLGYNKTGGYFLCKCRGYYYFSLHGVSPLQGRARLDLMHNHERVASSEALYYGYGTATNSAILHLQKDDVVYVILVTGSLYENDSRFRGYSSFTGYKIN